jgi:hypothetical protein
MGKKAVVERLRVQKVLYNNTLGVNSELVTKV